jgi:hypothetical protein
MQWHQEGVWEEIAYRVRDEQRRRGCSFRVHAAPRSTGDGPDKPDARLVILDPEHPHVTQAEDSWARCFAV